MRVGHFLDEGAAADAGIVEQDVDGAKSGQRRRYDVLRRLIGSDIGRQRRDGRIAGMDGVDRRAGQVDRQDRRTFLGEELDGGGPDSRGAARYDRNLARQTAHGTLLRV